MPAAEGQASPSLPLPPRLAQLRRALRQRAAVIAALWELPLIAVFAAAAYRASTPMAASLCLLLGLTACAAPIIHRLRQQDTAALLQVLHLAVPDFEDSLDLLLLPRAAGLAGLQRTRVATRVEHTRFPDLRPAIPWRRIGSAWGVGAALFALIVLWPSRHFVPAVAPSVTRSATMSIEPPAYTRLPSRRIKSFDAQVVAGTQIEFQLHLETSVTSASLRFDDGSTLPLTRATDGWRGARIMNAPVLYRVQIDAPSSDPQTLHRIDVFDDQPPRIIVKAPPTTLSLMRPAQKNWELEFDASDDYGLGDAAVSISLAQGSGEHITTATRTIPLEGRGDDRHRSYHQTLDLAELGFGVGDDLIVRFSVMDNHPSPPNRTQSASYILRWPVVESTAGEGIEGLVQKTLPAYFSSERQLIIDTEALLARAGDLSPARLEAQSDDLGVQQKTLRLRYGQFLGEEFESTAEEASKAKFGDAGSITTDFGHVHDKPGAATLFDTDTRRILKSAIDEMWQAELQLRQAHLDAALPFEYKALAYIKEVQQAERIYLARVGVALPETDAGRRLTGERSGLSDRDAHITAAAPAAAAEQRLWESITSSSTPDWAAIDSWIQQRRASLPDPLGALAAVDRAQHAPDCANCRSEIANRLWPLLPSPSTALEARRRPTAAAQAYLDALP